jgi:hypothetical protein
LQPDPITPKEMDEAIERLGMQRKLLDDLRRYGFVDLLFVRDHGRRRDVLTVPGLILDDHLKTHHNMSLEDFMYRRYERLPEPRGISRRERVLTRMWEREIGEMFTAERKVIAGFTKNNVPFPIAAQIDVLAEGSQGRLLYIAHVCGFEAPILIL